MASLVERMEALEARVTDLEAAVVSLGAAEVAALEAKAETNREAIKGIDALLAQKRRRYVHRSDL